MVSALYASMRLLSNISSWVPLKTRWMVAQMAVALLVLMGNSEQAYGAPSVVESDIYSKVLMVWRDNDGNVHSMALPANAVQEKAKIAVKDNEKDKKEKS